MLNLPHLSTTLSTAIADAQRAMGKSTFTEAGNLVHPSPEDWKRAQAFVDGYLADRVSLAWLAEHREQAVRSAAIAEMQKRQHAEWLARFATKQTRAA